MKKLLFLIRTHPESQSGKATCNQIEVHDWPAAITDDVGNTYTMQAINAPASSCSWYAVEHRPPSRVTIFFEDGTATVVVLD